MDKRSVQPQFVRTAMLLGEEAMDRLACARVAVFGIGGVGGYVAEALARTGIGALDLIDHDIISESNLNRQIIALRSTLGRQKTEVMRERLLDINPELKIRVYPLFFLPETADAIDFSGYTYVVDAIDTVTGKLEIITKAKQAKVPVISCMGAGNKLDPTAFCVEDISKTSVCPLARVMRTELKKRGIKGVKAVYSKEIPQTPAKDTEEASGKRRSLPGSVAFVPSAAGLVAAKEVILDIVNAQISKEERL